MGEELCGELELEWGRERGMWIVERVKRGRRGEGVCRLNGVLEDFWIRGNREDIVGVVVVEGLVR